MTASDPRGRRGSRLKLLLIMLVFAAPLLLALLLTVSGYQPGGKAYGRPIQPQRNLAQERARVRLDDGGDYPWRDVEPRLTLVALAGPGCATACERALIKLTAARITLNRSADRLRLLFVGEPPAAGAAGMARYWRRGRALDDKLAGFVPTGTDTLGALLVESNGTALAYYPAGFDPSGLRKDLQKVIR